MQEIAEAEPQTPKVVPDRTGWWTRDHALVVVLVIATAILLYLCWEITKPFLGALAWALALAIIARPVHCWLAERIKRRGLAAGLAVAIIGIIIVAPAVFVGHLLVKQATQSISAVQEATKDGKWKEQIEQKAPSLKPVISAIEDNGGIGAQIQGAAGSVGKTLTNVITGSVWAVMELLLTLFILFYLFRDRQRSHDALISLVPLSVEEAKEVMKRVSDTVHATIYGTLVVALVQGTLGGLMFWWLGLPAPLLWGAVMGLLAIIPVLGAFIIWIPAAIFLAASGEVGKALILTAWGAIVIGLIDNLLYPILVGDRMRMHTVPVFIAVVGGLMFFGAAGLVLGPLVLALTHAALDIWRRRTQGGRPAEQKLENAAPLRRDAT